jgi:hypothetical protein
MQKMLRKVSLVQAHPDTMSAEQVGEWFSVLSTLEGVRLDDVSGATPIRCKQGCLQSKFTIHFGNIAKMDVVLTQVYPGSRKYSVSSVTEYFNGTKYHHGTKEYNTVQREFLRQQELFQQQQHATMQRVAEHQHQHMVTQHHHNVMLQHHHHNF